jgi:hypothetical protein
MLQRLTVGEWHDCWLVPRFRFYIVFAATLLFSIAVTSCKNPTVPSGARPPIPTVTVEAFGISRQAFYVTEQAFQQQGIPGLLPRPRGPRRNHKCTEEVLDFVERWQPGDGHGRETLTQAVQRQFGIAVHPRSLERALARRKKKLATRRRSG